MVQVSETTEIQKRWEAAGRPPCEHKNLDREYYLGSHTGDWACMECGECFTRAEVQALREKRNG
ncbi:hypothetical protein [Streptomyces sp. VN1]|uniref:hypothetical protein n=1 Tax=Streptomyces sp. VN1 TaxID=1821625 RepID=UPI001E6575F1|nr:hypothetical protein [Streptomyces sp. VN1]